ncbi:MAG: hypothetical protein N5P05_000081 [Chroococcopsis gigantea SAG 12.99]|nr:hypothetical protein [Chroococcopsis gigantea SAG 12.99]
MSQSPVIGAKIESALPEPILEAEKTEVRKHFNRSPFVFSHKLAGHPLFDISRLVKLSETLLNTEGHRQPCCYVPTADIDSKWGEMSLKTRIAAAIDRIEEDDSWLLLYSVQVDPEYKALLDRIVTELEELLGFPLRQEITWLDAYIFIASPHAVTPYHIDHEITFLFQIQGEREVNLFDGNDRQILTPTEIENYYFGNLEAADYRAQNQPKANIFHLSPGRGVHHPSLAPHLYKNGESYSVALGIHFCLRSLDLQARVYQANYYLRKSGLHPTPPGQSRWKDNIKIAALGILSKRKPTTKYELLRSGVTRINKFLKLISKPLKNLKLKIKNVLTTAPIISDYYNYWAFSRTPNAYRGVFSTFTEAERAISERKRCGYDQAGYFSIAAVGEFNPKDYPIIFWLQSVLTPKATIFDFGGRLGETSYYAYRNYIHDPRDWCWTIYDVPEVVKVALPRVKDDNLAFTFDFSDASGVDIFLTCGTLQYVEGDLNELLSGLEYKPTHILINRVPFYDGPEYFTLQNLCFALTPYKIQNRSQFIKSIESIGYELIDSWQDHRTVNIPFHGDRFVSGYHGFYFRRIFKE